ncbi:phosphopantetheine-binding protein [Legionella bononiensis]|uniref:Acyl carrier protein n=1 Tax=Legionella bononiensis TaxID=2793102 RepID=A0ABS1W709_9GAMM|nr:phosphopantetheine-binding protein [Legionella bononiensis]MBL7481235.1 acyl carrier protein [Legionella bononiensis]MBL7525141.1 acyl carrier protein [Legionella bononiensis]MBL7562865.1 acyl carrier protein [Legionella bononiensis]
MLSDRIQNAFERIGLGNLPQDKDAQLEQGGLDSLMLALLILELEREFQIKIPVIPLIKEHYETRASIEKHLADLGAK